MAQGDLPNASRRLGRRELYLPSVLHIIGFLTSRAHELCGVVYYSIKPRDIKIWSCLCQRSSRFPKQQFISR